METTQSNLRQELEAVRQEAQAALRAAGSKESLEAVRIEYLGRKGRITGMMRGLKDVTPEERPLVGALANEIQEALAQELEVKLEGYVQAEIAEKLKAETIDVTMPGTYRPAGGQHPITRTIEDICAIFAGMGFETIDDDFCPEVETDFYNFDALNFPEHHPARDMQDTYYTDVASNVLLRSQTSNAQIRYMENHPLPIRVVSPGRVYRNEEVNSRKFVLFHQLEGLLVDDNVRFSDLKGILHEFTRQFFGGERPTRFRTSFFPFTEPSAEVDVQCIFCEGKGCHVCSRTGWLEVLGAGMVDPNVLRNVNIDPEKYNGFAFGMGIERLAMLKYSINDIRLFFNNDLRFLNQFKGL
ncbi:phenylalanine--tRNA ligase subunit alpha [Vampirovibrio sp.]|uniref:phenylalanine--tRNA ligase subunit alpha n=1 Tax=Vampirovibrio sp. TaxID=2717857 RepID=UPI0035930419